MNLGNRTRQSFLALLLVLAFSCVRLHAQKAAPPTAPDFRTVDFTDSEQFFATVSRHTKPPRSTPAVERLLKQMTLKEKIGQMTQLEIGMVSDGVDAAIHINPSKLHKAINEYGVGSILN